MVTHDTLRAPPPDFTFDAFEEYRSTIDPAARRRLRDRLVADNLRMAERFVRAMFRRYEEHLPDLIQEGAIGLVAAIESFDPVKGASFSSHAFISVRRHVQAALPRIVAGYSRGRRGGTALVSADAPARDDANPLVDTLDSGTDAVDDQVDVARRARILRRTLDAFSETDRAVLVALFDNSAATVSKEHGLSIRKVLAIKRFALPGLARDVRLGASSIAPGPLDCALEEGSEDPQELLDPAPKRAKRPKQRLDDAAALLAFADSPDAPEDVKRLLRLIYVEDKSATDAAKSLGISRNTVKSRIHAVRERLARRTARAA